MNRQYATQVHNLSKKSQEAINYFFNGGDKFIWSTVLCAQQKTRCAQILKTELGTLDNLIEAMDTELMIVWVLLHGLNELGKIKISRNGGGFCYRVKEAVIN